MKSEKMILEGVLLYETERHADGRGVFEEVYRRDEVPIPMVVQENLVWSKKGVLRGMHFQVRRPQAKLVACLAGAVHDVAVDLRVGSPTFGKWCGAVLTRENGRQLLVPQGFAHGYLALEDSQVLYRCSDYYDPEDEGGIRWDDQDVGISWSLVGAPTVSEKDQMLPTLEGLMGGMG
jgi:dTDP-4-dehydrorhamnose 3,5-epimerase